MLATAYLFTYNLVQLLGWTYLGWLAAAHLAAGGGLASRHRAGHSAGHEARPAGGGGQKQGV